MSKWIFALLAVVVLAGGIGALTSAEDAATYNVTITDHGVGLIRWFTRVSVLAFDPSSGAADASSATVCRLPSDPIAASTVVFDRPLDPIVARVPVGHYWILVWIDFLELPVPYVSFEVLEGQTTAIDLTQIQFPQGLITY
jgi:hypothetical protein